MSIIDKELILFEEVLSKNLSNLDNGVACDINDFVFSKSKKLRPKIIFLFAKALNKEITENIINLAISTELLHNATLIHDDIVDNAKVRRGRQSLNSKLGNSLSVLTGDYLLSLSMKFLAKCKDLKSFEIFSNSLKLMCEGEINQHFCIGEIPKLDEYIDKSEKKTAELFKASLTSLASITNTDEKIANDFAINFGIAFQIKDDLMNILQIDSSKPAFSDVHNKIYTAPVIFFERDIKNLSDEEIINLARQENIKQKTIKLIKEYADKAIASLADIKDNQYKKELIILCENLYKVVS